MEHYWSSGDLGSDETLRLCLVCIEEKQYSSIIILWKGMVKSLCSIKGTRLSMFSIWLEGHKDKGWTGCSSSFNHHQQGPRDLIVSSSKGSEERSVGSLMDWAQRAVGSMDSRHCAKSAELTLPMEDRHRTGRSKIWLAGRVWHKAQGRGTIVPPAGQVAIVQRCRAHPWTGHPSIGCNLDLTLATSSTLQLQKYREPNMQFAYWNQDEN
jgi:hypothetical protein